MKKLYYIFLLSILIFSSCEEDITYDLPPYKPKYVIYSILEVKDTNMIYVNRSKPYFDYADTTQLRLDNVTLTVTNKTLNKTDTLIARYKSQDDNGFFYYCLTPINPGHIYQVKLLADGEEITSEVRIPDATNISKVTYLMDTGDFSIDVLYKIHFQDKVGERNAYSLSINEWAYTGSDSFENRNDFSNIMITDLNSDGKILQMEYPGQYYAPFRLDSAKVEFIVNTLTYETYEFLNSTQMQQGSQGDPFSEPTIIRSNINNGLGLWGAKTPSAKYKLVLRF